MGIGVARAPSGGTGFRNGTRLVVWNPCGILVNGYTWSFSAIWCYFHLKLALNCSVMLRWRMASYYIRKDSPFYWIRVRRPDGSWGQKSSRLRHDEKGVLRKLHAMVAEETASEMRCDNEGTDALFNRWVPSWIKYKYGNTPSIKEAENCWAVLAIFLERRRVFHPQEVTYTFCHQFAQWRVTGDEGRRPVSLNTARKELHKLTVIMSEAVARGFSLFNPCRNLGLGRSVVKEKRVITRDEEAAIFAKLRGGERADYPWMADAFLVAMRQGCRLREVEIPLSSIDTEFSDLSRWLIGIL